MEILGTTLRIYVDDLDPSVAFYEGLTGSEALRFERGGVRVAAVGRFLLMSGPEAELEVLRKVTATIAVADVDAAHKALTEGSQGARGPGGDAGGPQPDRGAPGRRGVRVRGPAAVRMRARGAGAGSRPGTRPAAQWWATTRAGRPPGRRCRPPRGAGSAAS